MVPGAGVWVPGAGVGVPGAGVGVPGAGVLLVGTDGTLLTPCVGPVSVLLEVAGGGVWAGLLEVRQVRGKQHRILIW